MCLADDGQPAAKSWLLPGMLTQHRQSGALERRLPHLDNTDDARWLGI
jgi:hypothetical protein